VSVDLDELEALEKSATPGPWEVGQYTYSVMNKNGAMLCSSTYAALKSPEKDALCDFIAHAREDVPALIAEIERLRAELAIYADKENWQKTDYIKLEIVFYPKDDQLDILSGCEPARRALGLDG